MREAERAISYLGLFNYPVDDSVIINRILPEACRKSQQSYRERRAIGQVYRDDRE